MVLQVHTAGETVSDKHNGERLAVRPQLAADMLDCSRAMIYKLAKLGELDSFVLGDRGLRITVASVRRYIQQRQEGA